MNGIPSSEIVDAIYRLLPGFVTAWIFYGLTAHPKASSFERVIQALIFTLFVDAIVRILGWAFVGIGGATGKPLGQWSEDIIFVWKVIVAIGLGFILAWFANSNALHCYLPDSLTKRTSYPSEWFSAFHRTKTFAYLHMNDGRRIYGWPEEWPDEPGRGHFVLMAAEWILPDNRRVPLHSVERLVVPATDVNMVELEKDRSTELSCPRAVDEASAVMIEFNESDDDSESDDELSDEGDDVQDVT